MNSSKNLKQNKT
uniref:Uncharacterized protein n=1 Tax=Anguilla anguilla TaxID=7936 RepID=A0A0E9XZ41_ANGAN